MLTSRGSSCVTMCALCLLLQITLYVGPFTFVAPGAIVAGMFVRDVNPIVHLALSCFATGTFLYVGASEIVEEEFEGDMRSGR